MATDSLTNAQDRADELVVALQANADMLHSCERTAADAAREVAAVAKRALIAVKELPGGSLAEELARVENARQDDAAASALLDNAIAAADGVLNGATNAFVSHALAALSNEHKVAGTEDTHAQQPNA